MKLKVEEEIKTKLQLEAENGKVHYVNSNNKLKKRKTLNPMLWIIVSQNSLYTNLKANIYKGYSESLGPITLFWPKMK